MKLLLIKKGKGGTTMKRLIFIIIAMILGITLFTIGCARKSEKVKIGYIPFNADLPFFVAMEKGYFKEQGVEVDALRFGDSSQALNAMLARQIDMVAGLTFSIFFAAEQEAPARFKLLIPFAEVESKVMSYLLINKDSKISSLSDLKGKKVGTYTGATQLLYLKLFLKKIGIDPDKDVTILQVASDLQVQALAAKQFDALFTVEPYGTIALKKGAGKVLLENPRYHYIIAPFWSGAAAVDTDFFQKNPKTVKKIYKSLANAVDFITNNEVEAKRTLTKFTPMDESIALKSGLYKWYKIDESIDFASIQLIADFMYDYKLLNKKVDARALFFTIEDLK
jgi:NitT/TauT family transport system substrate-binding protein